MLCATVLAGAGAPGRSSHPMTSHPAQAGPTRRETPVSTGPDAGACQPALLDPVKGKRSAWPAATPDGRSAARLIGTIGPVDGPPPGDPDMLNRAEIIGRLTRDPELRYTPTGKPVAQMAIATNADLGKDENGERRETVEYHDVVMWGTTAETTARYLSKGRLVFVEGRLQTRSWEHEGITRRRTEIVASRVQFLDAAKAGTEFTGPQLAGAATGGDVDPDDVPF
ncbi:MAG: single-strand binding protein [Chloroflexi bacterium]|nr:single-strand binding protein [Chloroflexota bacterium]